MTTVTLLATRTLGERFYDAFVYSDRWKLYLNGLGVTLEITLFAAETYPGNAQKGRTFQAEVNKHKKIFDLYQMTPGFLHEARHSWNVKVREDEPVVVKLTGECGLNGILIRKKGD